MEKSEFTKVAVAALKELQGYFTIHSQEKTSNTNPEHYKSILKATVIKSYEFAASVDCHNEDYVFFTLPVLRGICEEFIVEKFLFEKLNAEKEEIVTLLSLYEHLESSIVQWNYFERNKPNQLLYYKSDFPSQLEHVKLKLKSLIKSKLPAVQLKPILPSIRYMSMETDLHELYSYLYHATSTFVHFNPHNLLRMGWGNLPHITYSASHFKNYYKDFALFYSILLLSKISDWQHGAGFLPNFDTNNISILSDILNRAKRYPEIVTFEEMNISNLNKYMFYQSPAGAKQESNI